MAGFFVSVFHSIDLPRHDQKAAVRRVVGAGGQRQQPVAAGVVPNENSDSVNASKKIAIMSACLR